ncbi:MAG: hypothetical protein UR93_C0009G0027 [Berkelbacteria bacterium GW2011_GWA2_35_9]|uniref:Uncharacterized protein n=1 Tax=Berkelbacteria bacterium GW2011_GWA2_35_9 TaxID=1618333 RepID=A0A0G0D3I6_9BACT|nr:MAG: hypothetical protein UR93_C0009G0027 [Berkelbacteria bacterium GW2011_GWA2_35_9]
MNYINYPKNAFADQNSANISLMSAKRSVIYRVITEIYRTNWTLNSSTGYTINKNQPFVTEFCSIDGGQVSRIYCHKDHYIITKDNLDIWYKNMADIMLLISSQNETNNWLVNQVELSNCSNLIVIATKDCINIWTVQNKETKMLSISCVFPIDIELK